MKYVLGIGGFFFRAKDPKALAVWYKEHLGIQPPGPDTWTQEAGQTAFTPFPMDTKHFGNEEKNWMLNFRVQNLDEFAEVLRSSGIEVTIDPSDYGFGKFARIHDPEGNPIELWEEK